MKTRKMVSDESTVRTRPVIAWDIAIFWVLFFGLAGLVWILAVLKVIDIIGGFWR